MRKALSILLAVLLAICLFVSCDPNSAGGGNGEGPKTIVGTWSFTSGERVNSMTLTAERNFTWTVTNTDSDVVEERVFGTYSTSGNKLVFNVTNLSEQIYNYTSGEPCFLFEEVVDATHKKLAFSIDGSTDPDSGEFYDYVWDDVEKTFTFEVDNPTYYSHEVYRIVPPSYTCNTIYIHKDGSGNEVFKEEMMINATAESMSPDPPATTKLFAKYYNYDFGTAVERLTISYTFEEDSLTMWWGAVEREYTRQ